MIYDGFLWFLKSHFAEKIYFRTLSPEVTLSENVIYA